MAKERPYSISFGNLDVGGVAVKKMTDQSVLADVAKNSCDSDVRCEATKTY